MNRIFAAIAVALTLSVSSSNAQDDDIALRPLKALVGDWKVAGKLQVQDNVVTSEGMERVESLGGSWFNSQYEASMGGMRHVTQLTLGYNDSAKTYYGVLVESTSKSPIALEGSVNENGILTLVGDADDKSTFTVMFKPINDMTHQVVIQERTKDHIEVGEFTYTYTRVPPNSKWCLITIKSEPASAEVFINNSKWGETEKVGFSEAGKYKVRLEKKGYEAVNEEIEIKKGAENVFSFQLLQKQPK